MTSPIGRQLNTLYDSEQSRAWRTFLFSDGEGNMTAPRFVNRYPRSFSSSSSEHEKQSAERDRGLRLNYISELKQISTLLKGSHSDRLRHLKSVIDTVLASPEVMQWLHEFQTRDPIDAMAGLIRVEESALGKQLHLLEEAYGEIALYYDIAERAQSAGWTTFPDVLDPSPAGPVLKITDGHAPLLFANTRSTPYTKGNPNASIPNSIDIGPGKPRNLIVTGPNAEGKSTYVRMISQLLILAESGSPVPAGAMQFSPMKVVAYDHPKDSMSSGDSLFMAEARALWQNIYQPALRDPHTLILMDEIIPGTIAPIRERVENVFLRKLAATGVISITATHNMPTTSLGNTQPGMFGNYHVDKYKVKAGAAEDMDAMFQGALTALEKAGWSKEFLDEVRPSKVGRSPNTQALSTMGNREIAFTQDLAGELRSANSDVVLIQDRHNDARIRNKLSDPAFVRQLKEQGFTHYLIEAAATDQMKAFLTAYNENRATLANAPDYLGPYQFITGGDKSFESVVKAMHDAGIKIVAIDHPANSTRWTGAMVSREEREQFMTDEIRALLQTNGKPLVLAGAAHTRHSPESGVSAIGVVSTADRLKKNGARVLSISFSSNR